MPEVFTYDEWRDGIAARAKRRSWDRDSLLMGLPMKVLGALPLKPAPNQQLDSDIYELNRIGPVEGVLPIERWLRNAAYGSELDTEAQQYFRERADEALKRAQPQPVAGSLPAEVAKAAATLDAVLPEKVLWESDLLPIAFLAGAARTALSVARLAVTRHEGGAVRSSPATGLPLVYFGTAWLIGPRHAITNHHVISARSPGEPAASAADFAKQALTSRIEFDYDDPNQLPNAYGCAKLLAFDQTLDFAILELADAVVPLNRDPLPLAAQALTINPGDYLPVNIVQHPGGQTKHLAIRNNAAAAIKDNNLSYFTDTQAGSSGSPVCNDQWQVVALHKAATRHMGKFTYQGRENPWVNIGTPITLIVQALKDSGAWDAIGAKLA